MDTVIALVDGQLHTGQEKDLLLTGFFPQVLVFLQVEFVVVGDDTDLDLLLLQCRNVAADVFIRLAVVLELLVPIGMQVEICPNCRDAMFKHFKTPSFSFWSY